MMTIKRIGLPCLLATSLLLTACSPVDSTRVFDQQQAAYMLHEGRTTQPMQERVKLALPNKRQWKQIDLSLGTVGSPIMLIPSHESDSQWTQSIRTQLVPFANDHDATVYRTAKNDMANAGKYCKQTHSDILSLNEREAYYRITLSNCVEEKNQVRYGKAMLGNDAIYVVYYTALPDEVSPQQIQTLANVVKTAKLVRDPRYGVHGIPHNKTA